MRKKQKPLSQNRKRIIAIGLSVAMLLSVPTMQAAALESEDSEHAVLLTEEMSDGSETLTEENAGGGNSLEEEKTANLTEDDSEAGKDTAVQDSSESAKTLKTSETAENPEIPKTPEILAAEASIGESVYDTLQEALNAAKEGETVCLHRDVNKSVIIRKAITLDLQGHSITGNGSCAVYINGADAKVINGTIHDTTASNGAGIYISKAEVLLEHISVTGNTATGGWGGGIYAASSSVTMNDCEVFGNANTYYGGGIGLYDCTLTANGLKVKNNTLSNNYGAGIYAQNSRVSLYNSEITGNKSGRYGGGIALAGSSLSADNTTIENNELLEKIYSSQVGGGIYLHDADSTLNLKGCNLNENKACQGGAIYAKGAVTLENCDIMRNETTYQGGGIYASASVTLEECTVTENKAESHGGAIFANGIKVSLKNTTVSGNHADGNGGGIMLSGGSSSAEMTDSTFSKNSAGSSGGGIGSYGTIAMENCNLTENTAYSNGGGIFSSSSYDSGNVTMTGGKIVGNMTDSRGGGLYLVGHSAEIKDLEAAGNRAFVGGGMYISTDENTSIENVVFTGNSATEAAAVWSRGIGGSEDKPIRWKNCTFTKNTGEDTKSIFSGGLKNILKNCIFSENNSPKGYVVDVYGISTELFLEDCLFEKNTSMDGTIHSSCSKPSDGIELKNTVIRYNEATGTERNTTGGISADGKGYLRVISGAIYENISGAGSGADDLFLSANSAVDVIKAEAMADGEKSFAGYTWHDEINGLNEKEALSSDSVSDRYFTAGKYDDRIVARIGEETFRSLQAAVNAAKEGERIVLIASETDGNAVLSVKPMQIDKDLILDLNGHTLQVRGGSGITVAGGWLELTGEGIIHGIIHVTGQGSISVTDGTSVDTLNMNGQRAYLNMKQDALNLILGEGKSAAVGEQFAVETLSVELDSAVLTALNGDSFLEANITLLTGVNDETLLDKIEIKGLENPLVQLVQRGDKIELEKKELMGVYLNGINGNDSASGLSKNAPVRTFEKAKEILAAHEELDTIYINGTVTVKGEDAWSLENGKMMRYPEYNGVLISVPGGSSLSLSHMMIDGASSYGLTKARSMISLRGSLEIGEETVLQNNNSAKASGVNARGGAISCDGTLTMQGGVIRNCGAEFGGGVYLYGDSVFTMNGGVMEDNFVTGSTNRGQGGAVMISHNAQMIINDGVLRSNRSEKSNGGAISVGGLAEQNASSLLKINGGTISENYAYNCGGGIYVECNSAAVINEQMKSETAVRIERNRCEGKSGWFGGGGIYVNGGVDGYKNGVLHAYNVAVYNNTAAGMLNEYGAGLAGCGTSNTKLYVTDGGVFYQNHSSEGIAEDILCSNVDHTTGVGSMTCIPTSHISEYMLGGGAYHWKDADGNEFSMSSIHTSGLHALHTELTAESAEIQKAMGMAGVIIAENASGTRGGGIGSNGDVIIGRPDDEENLCDVKATKIWDDNDDQRKLRPAQIKIWLVRNGEKISYQVCRPDENGLWQEVVFDRQPANDENGNPYQYTVMEDREGLDYRYVSSVEKVDEIFVITNTYKPNIPVIPTTPDDPTPGPGPDDPNPPIDIDDPDVPLGPGPGQDDPQPPVDIDEPDVPLDPGPGPDDDTSSNFSPKTGDDMPLMLLLGVLGISVLALGTAVYSRKKRMQ